VSHPPIPPNSPCWFEVTGDPHDRNGLWFSPFAYHRDPKNWSHDQTFPWDFKQSELFNEEERCIIAAVARCAWLDEAERLSRAYSKEHEQIVFSRVGDPKPDFVVAKENAEAWRVWGKTA